VFKITLKNIESKQYLIN